MSTFKKIFLLFNVILCFETQVNAQLVVSNRYALTRIKNGYTHIVANDLHFPHSDEFLAIFKKYWTLTKGVDIITRESLRTNLVVGDCYFNVDSYVETIPGRNSFETADKLPEIGQSNFYFYLNLWQPSEPALSGEKGKPKPIQIARIILSVSDKRYSKDDTVSSDFDGRNYYLHWNLGILKNYIQMMVAQIESGRLTDYYYNITNYQQLALLKDKILYFPDENLEKAGAFIRAGKTSDIKDVFDDYKFKYQSISDEALGEKILDDTEPFYYFLFVRDCNIKILAVINSKTGECIYSRSGSRSLGTVSLKSGDLKDLYKIIKKT